MPVISNNISVIDVPTVTTKNVNIIHIIANFTVNVEEASIEVHCKKGYTENNIFISTGRERFTLSGQDFIDIAETLTSGDTFYNELKGMLYNKLIVKGHISGSVS